MPGTFKNIVNKWWKVAISVITTAGIVFGVLEVVFWFSKWYDEEVAYRNSLEKMIEDNKSIKQDLKKATDYISKKKSSFAVGYRVFRELDEETGKIVKTKMYRDWSGSWHEVHFDSEMSEFYGVDHYFYIDDYGDKVYCW